MSLLLVAQELTKGINPVSSSIVVCNLTFAVKNQMVQLYLAQICLMVTNEIEG